MWNVNKYILSNLLLYVDLRTYMYGDKICMCYFFYYFTSLFVVLYIYVTLSQYIDSVNS